MLGPGRKDREKACEDTTEQDQAVSAAGASARASRPMSGVLFSGPVSLFVLRRS